MLLDYVMLSDVMWYDMMCWYSTLCYTFIVLVCVSLYAVVYYPVFVFSDSHLAIF